MPFIRAINPLNVSSAIAEAPSMSKSERTHQILAILYSDSMAADHSFSDLGYALRDEGFAVAGIVQINKDNPDREKCDMDVEELASGTVLRISEDRGKEAMGCRLDHGALAHAAALLLAALDNGPELVIVNKFGKVESQGKGLLDAIAKAVQLGIPTIVGVPYRNVDQWRSFTDGLAEECESGSPRILEWLDHWRLRPKDEALPIFQDECQARRSESHGR
jgi:hypothetical protein